jgi:hypothetical protein
MLYSDVIDVHIFSYLESRMEGCNGNCWNSQRLKLWSESVRASRRESGKLRMCACVCIGDI